MPGRPITLREDQYEVLVRARQAYQQETGQQFDWGQFLMFLLGIYLLWRSTQGGQQRSQGGEQPKQS